MTAALGAVGTVALVLAAWPGVHDAASAPNAPLDTVVLYGLYLPAFVLFAVWLSVSLLRRP